MNYKEFEISNKTAGNRFLSALSFEKGDRLPFVDFGYWPETIETWKTQGLPVSIHDDESAEVYFGLDRGFEQNLVNGFDETGEKNYAFRIWPLNQPELLDETNSTQTWRNGAGVVYTVSKSSVSIPQFISFPVQNKDDFYKLEDRLNANDKSRNKPNYLSFISKAKESNEAIGLWMDGFYAWPRELMGMEALSIALFEDRELIHLINRQHVYFLKQYLSNVLKDIDIDYVCFFEDMAFKTGPLLSPEQFQTFMLPYYYEICDFIRSKSIKKILIDSDGNTLKLVELFAQVADGHYPCEINAGSDPYALRKICPEMALIGGFNKMALIEGRSAIDNEFTRLEKMIKEGGYIPSVDHRVPPDVHLDHYKYYLDKKWKIIQQL